MILNKLPAGHWLFPEEKLEVVRVLLKYGLIKFSNARDLPLKSGTTDIYINLRDARNHPQALAFLTKVYQMGLQRLDVDRFIEIPDSVSCLAGPLSIATDTPYLTIRNQAKEDRVSDAKIIGQYREGDKTIILDDVITDGASKLSPVLICEERKLDNYGVMVLVDRQQGWQRYSPIMDVWAGMTLHDIRKILIGNHIMRRREGDLCDRNPIIVAYDNKSWDEILPIIDQLRITGCRIKVNDLVFDQGIAHLVDDLSVYGEVMVDLKLHEIPNTVKNACRHLLKCHFEPWAVTVHASGGPEMIAAAVDTLRGTQIQVLAVTVLTSIDPATGNEIFRRLPWRQVLKLAEMAHKAGAHGLVCSPKEVKRLRELYPNMCLVTPGVRSAGKDVGDQKRVGTPTQSMVDGADFLVMGRQILNARDPVSEVHRLLKEELVERL